MDTSESAFERLMERAQDLPEATWSAVGDLGRQSVEAMIAKQLGDVREMLSRGRLRVHGGGVEGHSAPLASVGQIAAQWQRAVSSVGAALEDVRGSAGRLPTSIVQRTTLMLSAAPAPGSIVLDLSPRADPFVEVAPEGQPSMLDQPRPLADRAAETLINLLSEAAAAGPDAAQLGDHIRELGARVASNVRVLAATLNDGNFDLDATWFEPGQPTARASVSSGVAGWLAQFVEGQALDSYEDELAGIVHTLSDVTKWLIETADGRRTIDVDELPPEDITKPRLGQTVRLRVRVHPTERPDGTTSETLTALELLDVQ